MSNVPSGTHMVSGAESQALRMFCYSNTFTNRDLDEYANLLQNDSLDSIRSDFEKRAQINGIEGARKSLADIRYGPTKVPLFNFLLQLIFLHQPARTRYLDIVRYLSLDAGVPVDSADLSGTTALMYSISTKPYFETEFANIMLKAGGNINHRNRYGCVAGHDIIMVTDQSAKGKSTAVDALRYFLDHGGDIDVADGDGMTVRSMGNSVKRLVPELGPLLGGQESGNGSLMGVKKEAKVGRNDPCRCGSKKKYKVCCGKV